MVFHIEQWFLIRGTSTHPLPPPSPPPPRGNVRRHFGCHCGGWGLLLESSAWRPGILLTSYMHIPPVMDSTFVSSKTSVLKS